MRFGRLRALASDAVSRIGSAVAASAKRKAHLDLGKQNTKENIRRRRSKPRQSRSAFADDDFSPQDNASLSNGEPICDKRAPKFWTSARFEVKRHV